MLISRLIFPRPKSEKLYSLFKKFFLFVVFVSTFNPNDRNLFPKTDISNKAEQITYCSTCKEGYIKRQDKEKLNCETWYI